MIAQPLGPCPFVPMHGRNKAMVRVIHQDKPHTFEGRVTGLKILKELGLKEEEVLLIKDGELLPLDEPVEEGEVRVVPVVSGG